MASTAADVRGLCCRHGLHDNTYKMICAGSSQEFLRHAMLEQVMTKGMLGNKLFSVGLILSDPNVDPPLSMMFRNQGIQLKLTSTPASTSTSTRTSTYRFAFVLCSGLCALLYARRTLPQSVARKQTQPSFAVRHPTQPEKLASAQSFAVKAPHTTS